MLNAKNSSQEKFPNWQDISGRPAVPEAPPPCRTPDRSDTWCTSLAGAIRDPDELIDCLQLPEDFRKPAQRAARLFPLCVPQSYLKRMQTGNPHDPLLLQILPTAAEEIEVPGFVPDPVGDSNARIAPGLLKKYAGRALLIASGACAVHCRYCFRRQYPYAGEPHRLEDWDQALQTIAADRSLHEIILSGGDPLMLSDARLSQLVQSLADIPHLTRLRIHTRLPIVLPDRVTPSLVALLSRSRLASLMVVHANHPRELETDCAQALRTLTQSKLTVLNQAVLLRGVNNDADTLTELCLRLVDLGVIPYYLHQLDPVAGASHFKVSQPAGCDLIRRLRCRLPGYAVPQFVREVPGAPHKVPLV